MTPSEKVRVQECVQQLSEILGSPKEVRTYWRWWMRNVMEFKIGM